MPAPNGTTVGETLGTTVGEEVGETVGAALGVPVGEAVGDEAGLVHAVSTTKRHAHRSALTVTSCPIPGTWSV